jgi:hypothetical protein
MVVASEPHDRDDLLDRRRVGWVADALVTRRAPGVVARHGRRRTTPAGGIEHYGHGHGSSSHETADRSAPRLPARSSRPLEDRGVRRSHAQLRRPLQSRERAPAQARGGHSRRPDVVPSERDGGTNTDFRFALASRSVMTLSRFGRSSPERTRGTKRSTRTEPGNGPRADGSPSGPTVTTNSRNGASGARTLADRPSRNGRVPMLLPLAHWRKVEVALASFSRPEEVQIATAATPRARLAPGSSVRSRRSRRDLGP